MRDTVYKEVTARLRCLRCGQTFRVYPLGIDHDQPSQRLRGLAVQFYIMGLSQGAVSLVMTALSHPLGKTAAYEAVQAVGKRWRVCVAKRCGYRPGTLVAALGADLTLVKCNGEWLTVEVTTDAIHGTALTIDILDDAESQTIWTAGISGAGSPSIAVQGSDGERMDGTNNATQLMIGWRVKEPYRTMRGYKRPASVLNVRRLIAWEGNLLDGAGADLAEVIA